MKDCKILKPFILHIDQTQKQKNCTSSKRIIERSYEKLPELIKNVSCINKFDNIEKQNIYGNAGYSCHKI